MSSALTICYNVEELSVRLAAESCKVAISRMHRFLRETPSSGVTDLDMSRIKVNPDGSIRMKASPEIRVESRFLSSRKTSLMAMVAVSQEKGLQIRMQRREIRRKAAVQEACMASRDLAQGISPKSSRAANIRRAAVAGVILGGIALTAAIFGPEAAAKLSEFGVQGAQTPLIMQVMSFATEIGHRATEAGPEVLEAFRNGFTLGAARIAEMSGAAYESVREFASPALSWISSQRGEIVSAMKGTLDVAGSIWAEIAPTSFADGLTKGFGFFGATVTFVQSIEYVRDKLFGKTEKGKENKKEEPPQVAHHHHHHHYHGVNPENVEEKAVAKISEPVSENDPEP